MNENGSADVKSAARVMEILEVLAARPEPLTAARLAADLGYPKASLHGLLKTMLRRGWIEEDAGGRGYVLGLKAWHTGQAYQRIYSLAERALPLMQAAGAHLGETVQLAILDGGDAVYVAKVDGPRPLRLESFVGGRLPAYCTGVGKALLAGLDEAEVDRRLGRDPLPDYTRHTITDPAKLRTELRLTRKRGYAIDREERTLGAVCVARPVRGAGGNTVAAMSCTVPKMYFDAERMSALIAGLGTATAGLSAALGYRDEP